MSCAPSTGGCTRTDPQAESWAVRYSWNWIGFRPFAGCRSTRGRGDCGNGAQLSVQRLKAISEAQLEVVADGPVEVFFRHWMRTLRRLRSERYTAQRAGIGERSVPRYRCDGECHPQESLDHGENHPSHRRRGRRGLGRVRVFHAFSAPTKLPLVSSRLWCQIPSGSYLRGQPENSLFLLVRSLSRP
jgi:hypothetical protein